MSWEYAPASRARPIPRGAAGMPPVFIRAAIAIVFLHAIATGISLADNDYWWGTCSLYNETHQMPARSLDMMSQDRAIPLLATCTTVELLSIAPMSKFQKLHACMHSQTLSWQVRMWFGGIRHARKSRSSSLKLYYLIRRDDNISSSSFHMVATAIEIGVG